MLMTGVAEVICCIAFDALAERLVVVAVGDAAAAVAFGNGAAEQVGVLIRNRRRGATDFGYQLRAQFQVVGAGAVDLPVAQFTALVVNAVAGAAAGDFLDLPFETAPRALPSVVVAVAGAIAARQLVSGIVAQRNAIQTSQVVVTESLGVLKNERADEATRFYCHFTPKPLRGFGAT